MILLDANILVYAKVQDFEQHGRASAWLDSRLNGPVGVGLPWPSLLAFVRFVSNPRVFARPMSIADAWAQVEAWRSSPVAFTPEPTERHEEILAGLIDTSVKRSNLLPDAHLAALAIEYGLTLCSTDGDFARFGGLSWENPLA